MFQTLSYQLYSATAQPTSDLPSREIAAGVRDLRTRLGRTFRPLHRVRPARRAIVPARVLPSGR